MRYSSLNDVLTAIGHTAEFADVEITAINARGIFGNTPLSVVMSWPESEGGLRAAELLLDAGADVNARVELGFTALHEAASRGKTATVKLLLDRNALVTIKNDWGQTALDLARLPEIIELLRPR